MIKHWYVVEEETGKKGNWRPIMMGKDRGHPAIFKLRKQALSLGKSLNVDTHEYLKTRVSKIELKRLV